MAEFRKPKSPEVHPEISETPSLEASSLEKSSEIVVARKKRRMTRLIDQAAKYSPTLASDIRARKKAETVDLSLAASFKQSRSSKFKQVLTNLHIRFFLLYVFHAVENFELLFKGK
jgi:hypothetical protein